MLIDARPQLTTTVSCDPTSSHRRTTPMPQHRTYFDRPKMTYWITLFTESSVSSIVGKRTHVWQTQNRAMTTPMVRSKSYFPLFVQLLLLLLLQGWMIIRGSALLSHPALYRSLESIQQRQGRGVTAGRGGRTLLTTKLASDLSSSFLTRDTVGVTKMMTTTSTKRRSSPRLFSSSNQESSSDHKTPVKKKKTAVVKKKNKKPAPKTGTAAAPSDDTPKEGTPWYHMFTKGDEEYNQYMATEWGFEKVHPLLKRSDAILLVSLRLIGSTPLLSIM